MHGFCSNAWNISVSTKNLGKRTIHGKECRNANEATQKYCMQGTDSDMMAYTEVYQTYTILGHFVTQRLKSDNKMQYHCWKMDLTYKTYNLDQQSQARVQLIIHTFCMVPVMLIFK